MSPNFYVNFKSCVITFHTDSISPCVNDYDFATMKLQHLIQNGACSTPTCERVNVINLLLTDRGVYNK